MKVTTESPELTGPEGGNNAYNLPAAEKDSVYVDAAGDWTATLKFKYIDNPTDKGWYEFLGFYAWDNWNNYVGTRAGDGAMQIQKAVNGTATNDYQTTTLPGGLKSATYHWLRIEKNGTSYKASASTDGVTFTEISDYGDLGITGDKIAIDAYSLSLSHTGLEFYLEYLYFGDDNGAMNQYGVENAAKAIEKSIPAEMEVGAALPASLNDYKVTYEGGATVTGTVGDKVTVKGTVTGAGGKTATVTKEVALKANKTALKKAIAMAAALKGDIYTAASYKTVTDALAEAKTVEANADAKQTEVDAAAKKLNDAIRALDRNPAEVDANTINFLDPAEGTKYTIEGQVNAKVTEGRGLRLVSTHASPENTDSAGPQAVVGPKDWVKVPVADGDKDWTATLKLQFSIGTDRNGWYESFGFYACDDSEGDLWDNFAGIRPANGNMQSSQRVNGVTDTSQGTGDNTGLTTGSTFWFRLVKKDSNYTTYYSKDGETFTQVSKHEGTNISGKTLVIDAYSGMSEGYTYDLEYLYFGDDDDAMNQYGVDNAAKAIANTLPTEVGAKLPTSLNNYTITYDGDMTTLAGKVGDTVTVSGIVSDAGGRIAMFTKDVTLTEAAVAG